jgi:hypothetical protein
MHTLHLRYTIDPNRVQHFRTYVENELAAIREAGGSIIGYFLPTDFAGPTNTAYGLIDFESFDSYEKYREKLAESPLHRRNAEALTQSGALLNIERTFIERCTDGKED